VAVTRRDGADDDVWRIELESGLASRVTFNKDARFPIWSPNGEALAYTVGMTGPGTPRLNRKAASGAGEDQEIGGPAGLWAVFAEDWSRDGRWLLYTATSASGWGIGTIDLTTGKSSPLVDPPANQVLPALSPGDEWLAYSSDESGVWEVYVQPFPEGHGRWQVSTGGGSRPVWRGDGKELFYIDAKGSLIAVAIEPSQTFATGAAKPLFSTDLPPMLAPFRSTYAASPDGQRFLVERMLPAATESTISVIVDWPAAVDE
jgi:Tol biopolymer transport system component